MLQFHFPRLSILAIARGLVLIIGTLLVTLWPLATYAATINVDGTTCTLPDAIEAANTDAAFGGCTAGSGSDLLLLNGLTHSLATGPFDPNSHGLTATPAVSSTITISGGVGGAMVERNGPAQYRLFYVDAMGDLTLQNVTVYNGNSKGDGGAIQNRGHLTLVASTILSNTAIYGGGVINIGAARLDVFSSAIISNTARGDGGGLENTFASTLHIANSSVKYNKAELFAGGYGGGIDTDFGSTLVLTSTEIVSNSAATYGGGINILDASTVSLTDATIISNTATRDGGGINHDDGSKLTVADSIIDHNRAGDDGGGINTESLARLTMNNTMIRGNIAADNGGGISNSSQTWITATATLISDNNAADNGGGIYNYNNGNLTLTNSQVLTNSANLGGGLYNGSAITATSVQLIGNSAILTGSAIYQEDGQTLIDQSCIVNNRNLAVVHDGGSTVDADNNWWGSPDGPSGVGPGSGDSVTINVAFSPFLTNAILNCPLSDADIAFSKSVSPSGNLVVGQPVTYTLTVANNGPSELRKIYVTDSLPAAFVASNVITEPGTTFNGTSYVISDLVASEAISIVIFGKVSSQLSQNVTLTNTATLSHSLTGEVSATTTNKVLLSAIHFGTYSYSDTLITATVELTAPVQFVTVTAQLAFTATNQTVAQVPVLQLLTFPAGTTSQQLLLPLSNNGVAPTQVELVLQLPIGAVLVEPRKIAISFGELMYFPKLRR